MVKLEIELDKSVQGRDFRNTDYEAPSRLLARVLRHQGRLPTKPAWVGKWDRGMYGYGRAMDAGGNMHVTALLELLDLK